AYPYSGCFLYSSCLAPLASVSVLSWRALSPGPTVGVPSASSGGQTLVQCSIDWQVSTFFESGVNMNTVIPFESVMICPSAVSRSSIVAADALDAVTADASGTIASVPSSKAMRLRSTLPPYVAVDRPGAGPAVNAPRSPGSPRLHPRPILPGG